MREAYRRLPWKARRLLRDARVRRILRADPTWRVRKTGDREADARFAALTKAARG